jgi:hypothetical protein
MNALDENVTDKLIALALPHIHEPQFVSLLQANMQACGMGEREINVCLAKFLPQVRERARLRLH